MNSYRKPIWNHVSLFPQQHDFGHVHYTFQGNTETSHEKHNGCLHCVGSTDPAAIRHCAGGLSVFSLFSAASVCEDGTGNHGREVFTLLNGREWSQLILWNFYFKRLEFINRSHTSSLLCFIICWNVSVPSIWKLSHSVFSPIIPCITGSCKACRLHRW